MHEAENIASGLEKCIEAEQTLGVNPVIATGSSRELGWMNRRLEKGDCFCACMGAPCLSVGNLNSQLRVFKCQGTQSTFNAFIDEQNLEMLYL
jgi:hypothetical protein